MGDKGGRKHKEKHNKQVNIAKNTKSEANQKKQAKARQFEQGQRKTWLGVYFKKAKTSFRASPKDAIRSRNAGRQRMTY